LIKHRPFLQVENFTRHSKHFVPEVHLSSIFLVQSNQGSSIRLHDNLGMGKRSIMNYVDICLHAILTLHEQCCFLPSAEEKQEISLRLHKKITIKNCVGMIDGTHLNLSTRPEYCGEEYYTCKIAMRYLRC
jgi:hypothetical protein